MNPFLELTDGTNIYRKSNKETLTFGRVTSSNLLGPCPPVKVEQLQNARTLRTRLFHTRWFRTVPLSIYQSQYRAFGAPGGEATDRAA